MTTLTEARQAAADNCCPDTEAHHHVGRCAKSGFDAGVAWARETSGRPGDVLRQTAQRYWDEHGAAGKDFIGWLRAEADLRDANLLAQPTADEAEGDGREALAVALCNADTSWEHHDQTDDHPCARCRYYADAVLAAGFRRRDPDAGLRARVTALAEMLREATESETEPCRLDHNGDCQEHGYHDGPCLIPRARAALADTPSAPDRSTHEGK